MNDYLINFYLQIAAVDKAYTDQGVSLEEFIDVPQPEDCTYDYGTGCDF